MVKDRLTNVEKNGSRNLGDRKLLMDVEGTSLQAEECTHTTLPTLSLLQTLFYPTLVLSFYKLFFLTCHSISLSGLPIASCAMFLQKHFAGFLLGYHICGFVSHRSSLASTAVFGISFFIHFARTASLLEATDNAPFFQKINQACCS